MPVFICSDYQQIEDYILESATCRVDRESMWMHTPLGLGQFGSLLMEKAGNADAVIISDYGKGFATNEAIELLKVQRFSYG